MQKFDQEPKRIETFSGIDDEFEYISPTKQQATEKQVAPADDFAVQNENFAIDQELQLAAKPAEIKSGTTDLPQVNGIHDDLGLDDLSDLDDVEEIAKAPLQQPNQQSTTTAINPDSEKNSDDIDLDLEDPEPENHDEDVEENYDDDEAVEEEDHEETEAEDDEFKLDLDLDEEIDLDDDNQDEDQQQISTPKLSEKSDNDDLEELLEDEANAAAKAKKDESPQSKTANDAEDEFLDAGKNEDENVVQKVSLKRNKIEDLDDIDLDELDEIANRMDVDLASQKAIENNAEVVPEADLEHNITTQNKAETILPDQNFSQVTANILESKLDAWLDKNLRSLVESIVQQEVKKLFEKR